MAADKKRCEQYQRALAQIQEMAEQAATGIDAAALTEEQRKQALCRLKKTYGDMAKVAAREYYLAERASARAGDSWDIGLTHNVSDAFVISGVDKCRADGEEVGKFIGKTAMMAAERQISFCASSDPLKPRWAFVAHLGACEWCRMISSNGWRYHSEETAGAARHPGCTCAVVADFDTDNPSLEGYDPQALYEEYRRAADMVESESVRLWRRMSVAERAAAGGDYGKFHSKRVLAQMRANKRAMGATPLTAEEALAAVNPNWSWGDYAWTCNCQRCVVAYEANRRGIRCEAKPRLRNDTIFKRGSAWYEAFADDSGKALGPTRSWLKTDVRRASQWEAKFDAYIKDRGWENVRGIIHVEWKHGGAHVFNFETVNGTVHYYDSQIGKEVSLESWLSKCKPTKTRFIRVDDLDFTNRLDLCITRK